MKRKESSLPKGEQVQTEKQAFTERYRRMIKKCIDDIQEVRHLKTILFVAQRLQTKEAKQ